MPRKGNYFSPQTGNHDGMADREATSMKAKAVWEYIVLGLKGSWRDSMRKNLAESKQTSSGMAASGINTDLKPLSVSTQNTSVRLKNTE